MPGSAASKRVRLADPEHFAAPSEIAVAERPSRRTAAILARSLSRRARRDRAPRRFAFAGGSGRPVDARCQPDQMASRPCDVVLRAVSAASLMPEITGRSMSVSPICTIPITFPPDRAQARPQRGLITRPSAAEVAAYRAHVDAAVAELIESASDFAELVPIIEIGLHHEQQHQELLLTDILHAFSLNETHPAYDPDWQWPRTDEAAPSRRDARRVSIRSGTTATAFASTTSSRRIRSCCGRCGLRRSSSPTASGSISWPTAATRRRRCGCRTAGRPSRRKVGARRAIGARSTAPGFR